MTAKLNAKEVVIVNLLVNNDRQKVHSKETDPTLYLKDEQEFELELISHFQKTIGIKIKINGSYISQSHLIMKPGERIVLDRFIDKPNKFKFSEYNLGIKGDEYTETSKNFYNMSEQGFIEVEAYRAYQEFQIQKINEPYITLGGSFGANNYNQYYNNTNYNTTITCNDLNSMNYVCGDSTISNFKSFNEVSNVTNEILSKSLNIEPEMEKGGEINEGSKSQQTFEYVNTSFSTYKSYSYKFRLKPISSKPIEVSDLKKYCTECGKKANKEHKFCANCGTKL